VRKPFGFAEAIPLEVLVMDSKKHLKAVAAHCLRGEGKGTREIAEQLCLSVKTVETYRARIKEK